MAQALRRQHHAPREAILMQGLRLHEGDGIAHVHELTLDQKGKLTEYIWKVENVELTTVGIDIGSSTSHLMFATVRLQRKTQALSSQFVMVERRILWKSPILLTPFLPDGTIDAAALGDFVGGAYRQAGIAPDAVDTGAVILTGEAIKRSNARAIADIFAADSGRFVCASAGHHLECALAAHGSGAVALSRESSQTILNVDVGGGTTKLALVDNGQVAATCAIAVGGRLMAFDEGGALQRIDESAQLAAAAIGVPLRVGERPSDEAVARVVDALAEAAISIIRGEEPAGLAKQLLLTGTLGAAQAPQAITFSGGVAEFIYGREKRDFGDIARALAERIAAAFREARMPAPMVQPREGIRATVIGASQFTVQVSGKTIHISEDADLPLRNVPVLAPVMDLGEEIDVARTAAAIHVALERSCIEEDRPIALAVHWKGDPLYRRLRNLAEGIALALAPRTMSDSAGASHRSIGAGASQPRPAPLVLMIDGDVGRTLGYILEHEIAIGRHVVSIDGIQLKEFDFVDIGEVIRPADVVPVVIKSLLFSGAAALAGRPGATRYKPIQKTRSAAQ
jgi:ethanolamine utilization protein EutA